MSKRNLSPYLSRKITHLMFLCSILVVYIHFNDYTSYVGNPSFYVEQAFENMLSQGFARVAVPMFFMISGYLTFSVVDIDRDYMIRSIPHRMQKLLVPYLIWNTVSMVYYLLLSFVTHTNLLSVRFVLESVFLYKTNGPFWYVFQLIIITLISPLLWELFRRKKLAVFTLLCFLIMYLLVETNTKLLLLPGLLFYSIGAVGAMHFKNIIDYNAVSAGGGRCLRLLA